MGDPVRIELIGDRGIGFSTSIGRIGVNWTGATFRAQVRVTADAPGSPLISLLTSAGVFLQYGGSATLAAHIAAGRITPEIYKLINPTTGENYAGTDTLQYTQLLIGIAPNAMKGAPAGLIPFPQELGEDIVLAWDLLVDADAGGTGNETKEFYGPFRVRGTVTQ